MCVISLELRNIFYLTSIVEGGQGTRIPRVNRKLDLHWISPEALDFYVTIESEDRSYQRP